MTLKLPILFSVLISVNLALANEQNSLPTDPSEIISKATNLALQHDRNEASQMLITAIQKIDKSMEESSEPRQKVKEVRAKLVNTLNQISRMFFQDKTQQLHEIAQSLRGPSPDLAMKRLDEAQRLEPDNLSVMLMRANLLLAERKCKPAAAEIERALLIHPFSSEVHLAKAQSHFCDQENEAYFLYTSSLEGELKQGIFWQLLDAHAHFLNGSPDKALEGVESLLSIDKDYPEAYFVLFLLIQEESGLDTKEKGRIKTEYEPDSNYLNKCSTLSMRARRKYFDDPWLCHPSQLSRVESAAESAPPEVIDPEN